MVVHKILLAVRLFKLLLSKRHNLKNTLPANVNVGYMASMFTAPTKQPVSSLASVTINYNSCVFNMSNEGHSREQSAPKKRCKRAIFTLTPMNKKTCRYK